MVDFFMTETGLGHPIDCLINRAQDLIFFYPPTAR